MRRLPASYHAFQGTDRLKFTAEEQARIRDAEQLYGYRRPSHPEIRFSGAVGLLLAALFVGLLVSVIIPLAIFTYSRLQQSLGIQPEMQSAQMSSHVQQTWSDLRPASQSTQIDEPSTPIAAQTPIMPEVQPQVDAVESQEETEPEPDDGGETSFETQPQQEDEVFAAADEAPLIQAPPESEPPTQEPAFERNDISEETPLLEQPALNAESDPHRVTAPKEKRRVIALRPDEVRYFVQSNPSFFHRALNVLIGRRGF